MSLLELYAIGAPVIALALMGLFGLLLFRRDVAGFALVSAGTAKANSEPEAETSSRAASSARFAGGEPGPPDTSTTHRPTLLAAQEAPARPRNLSSSSSRKERERPGRTPTGSTALIEAQMPEGKPADLTQPDWEIPDKLLRGMHATVPVEQWGATEDQLRRAYNIRLRQSEEIAAAFIERETQAFENAARKSSLSNLAKAAAAAVAAAAHSLRYLWR